MGIANFLEKKQRGDASRIAEYLKLKNVGDYSVRMVNYMLDGERTMPEEVREVVQRYYEVQEEMTKTMLV